MTQNFLSTSPMLPITGETVVDKIIRRMTEAIRQGKFKMGEKLPSEFELMDELHVSRNSLREAMKIMSAMGILEIKRGDGTYICSQVKPTMFDSVINSLILESSSNDEIIELRQTLDEAVLKLAAKKATQKDIDQLEQYIREMRGYFKEDDISKAAKVDYLFHIYLIDCCKNPFLARIVKGVYLLFEPSIEKNIRTEEEFAKADEYHQEIVDCLKSKSYEAIEKAIANSLSSWKKNVKQ